MESAQVSSVEVAIGLEVRLEATRKGLTHRQIQEVTGIKERTFRRYFVQAERNIPVNDLIAVAAALGIGADELLRRAQDQASHDIAPGP